MGKPRSQRLLPPRRRSKRSSGRVQSVRHVLSVELVTTRVVPSYFFCVAPLACQPAIAPSRALPIAVNRFHVVVSA